VLAKGNARADSLAAPVWTGPRPDIFSQARTSHAFFHQGAKVIARQFKLPISEAKAIVQSCHSCQQLGPGIGQAVNPRGLHALDVWQMDVTHVPEFGRFKYVHVSMDCFSHAIWATTQ
ncbi:PO113 protein, partial [Bucorvus abyssinicus]|nr:PO113 protein [Bucorvus abyssinicus]